MKKKRKNKNSFRSRVNNSSNDDMNFSIIEVIIIMLFSVIFGLITGYFLTYNNSNLKRIRSDKYLKELVETYDSIVNNYYKEIDGKDLANAGIKGMVNSLNDPYSFYLDKESTADLEKSVSGEYVGIGVTIEFNNNYNRIISVVPNGPAYKAGLLEGDLLLSVDNKEAYGIYPTELNEWISGEKDTFVVISVLRNNIPIDFKVYRDTVEIWSVSSKILEDNIGYMSIDVFSANSGKQFKELLNELEEDNIKSLIIDLRNNPGGQVSQVNEILNLFFKKKTVLYQIESDGKKTKIKDTTKESRSYPVVILVNNITASSSEILATSFRENYKNVVLVGTNTFGKGSVQKNIPLGNGSSYKYTVQKWYTAKGVFIDNNGITPDIVIEKDHNPDVDSQLLEAISILKK